MKYAVLFEKCYTYELEVEAENEAEAGKKAYGEFRKLLEQTTEPFENSSQEGRWEQVDINEQKEE